MSKKCLSIPFIFDGEEYRVVYSPWSRISNRDWYPAVCQEYNEYRLKHLDFGLPTYKDTNYMEEVMRFYYREWVADVVSSREAREREEEQYNYILNKNYAPDEVKYE